MNTARVAGYWRETFGVSEAEYERAGVVVVPHSPKLAGRKACWIFVHGQTCIVSVPPALVEQIGRIAQQMRPEMALKEDAAHRLFPGKVSRTVGPSYQGFVESEGFLPVRSQSVRRLRASDGVEVRAFRQSCGSTEWDDCGLDEEQEPLFGYFEGSRLVALAASIPWASYAANLGILVHPGYRGKGYGKAAASAAMESILCQGSVVLYQTLLSNGAAVGIAEALGCGLYGRMMFVELG